MRFVKKYIPVSLIISALIFALAAIALSFSRKSHAAADIIETAVGAPIRRLFAHLTSPLSFSLAGAIIVSVPLILALIIFLAVRTRRRTRFILKLLSLVLIIASLYTFSMGVSYNASPISEKMGFSEVSATEEDIYALALYVTDMINREIPNVDFSRGYSTMPYGREGLSAEIVDAYGKFLLDYPIFENFNSTVKVMPISDIMASGGISGIYTFFTGEANISSSYPDYCIAATAMHELSHQRGIMRENEANFIAYTAAVYSDSAYLRYSGYLNLLEHLLSALSKTSRERVSDIYSRLSSSAIEDLKEYNRSYNEHNNPTVRKIFTFFNDGYLKANGTPGVVSYGKVVTLSVSYYKAVGAIP